MTVDDVISKIPRGTLPLLPSPEFIPDRRRGRIMLAVETFSRHMTDEGWQLQLGLEEAGYCLYGKGFPHDETSVPDILALTSPGTVIVQDKREWDPTRDGCFDKTVAFRGCGCLRDEPHVFRVTVSKDAHQGPAYHRAAHDEIGTHAWIVYYNPRVVCHMASWIRPEHCIRTYHSLNSEDVPVFASERRGCLLSGAISEHFYPLRTRLARNHQRLPETVYLQHPGYNANGHKTPGFLKTLSKYKVAICTASIFGYTLRKLIEATACGCRVITDLPYDEVMPEIDGNFIRVEPSSPVSYIADVVSEAINSYDPDLQRRFAKRAIAFYDYRSLYGQLAYDIASMRRSYE